MHRLWKVCRSTNKKRKLGYQELDSENNTNDSGFSSSPTHDANTPLTIGGHAPVQIPDVVLQTAKVSQASRMTPVEFNSLFTVIQILRHYLNNLGVADQQTTQQSNNRSGLWTRFNVHAVKSSVHMLFGNLPVTCIRYTQLVNIAQLLRYQAQQIDVHVINNDSPTESHLDEVPDMCIHIQLPLACLAYLANPDELHSSITPIEDGQRVYQQAYARMCVSVNPAVHLYDSAQLVTQQKSTTLSWHPAVPGTLSEDQTPQTPKPLAALEHINNTTTRARCMHANHRGMDSVDFLRLQTIIQWVHEIYPHTLFAHTRAYTINLRVVARHRVQRVALQYEIAFVLPPPISMSWLNRLVGNFPICLQYIQVCSYFESGVLVRVGWKSVCYQQSEGESEQQRVWLPAHLDFMIDGQQTPSPRSSTVPYWESSTLPKTRLELKQSYHSWES
jgi:hypothetical protein